PLAPPGSPRTDTSLVTPSARPRARPAPWAASTSSATLRAPAPSTSATTTWAPSAASRGGAARPVAPVRRRLPLVEPQCPVPHGEGAASRERDVPPEGGGRAEHGDGVVIDVVDDAGGAPILAGGEHAEPAHPDHAGIGVEEGRALAVVRLEVGGVVGDEAFHARLQRGLHRLGIAGPVHGYEAGQPLGVQRGL